MKRCEGQPVGGRRKGGAARGTSDGHQVPTNKLQQCTSSADKKGPQLATPPLPPRRGGAPRSRPTSACRLPCMPLSPLALSTSLYLSSTRTARRRLSAAYLPPSARASGLSRSSRLRLEGQQGQQGHPAVCQTARPQLCNAQQSCEKTQHYQATPAPTCQTPSSRRRAAAPPARPPGRARPWCPRRGCAREGQRIAQQLSGRHASWRVLSHDGSSRCRAGLGRH